VFSLLNQRDNHSTIVVANLIYFKLASLHSWFFFVSNSNMIHNSNTNVTSLNWFDFQ
jgi:hypothetical protein